MAAHRVVSSPVAGDDTLRLGVISGSRVFAGSRRGGDNCTAAARKVGLVLAGGWLLAGHAKLLRRRETGMPRALSRTGEVVLSCSSFVVMLVGALSRD